MRRVATAGGGLGDGLPRPVWVLLTIVFATWSLQFFAVTAPLVALLRLTPEVWRSGFLWQILTYPLIGVGPASPWILLELFVLAMFAASLVQRLGRRGMWRLLAVSAVVGAVAAVAVDAIASTWGGGALAYPLMQGQRALLAAVIAAFATLNPRATIMLFFVIPMPARWFLPLELLLAFIGFLATKDFAGFVGLVAIIAAAWVLARGGGAGRGMLELRLQVEAWWLRQRMGSARRKRGFTVIPGGRDERPN